MGAGVTCFKPYVFNDIIKTIAFLLEIGGKDCVIHIPMVVIDRHVDVRIYYVYVYVSGCSIYHGRGSSNSMLYSQLTHCGLATPYHVTHLA